MQALIDSRNFAFLEAFFAEILTPHGFKKEGSQYDGAFGSHYVDFVFNGKAYRLIADGREFQVILDCTDNYSESHFGKGWTTLVSTAYPANITKDTMQFCFAKVRDYVIA
ncbi:hypothetical protein [Variovorax sp. PCZ-1]|uniref:hypothetical protein n=1 Tax=Variovorax sp. PCZ-1 TaxID=2835533 RepID=UPI001BCF307C|nr:hypothetical protein [Variovorax sp. PCZ-1]MBS7806588.1 hypothetical protein [Variovorax sp. PCZ-1]